MTQEPTVFVIDDDPGIQKSLEMVLKSGGLSAKVFASAEDFLAAQTGDERGCILLDLRLSGMTGLELLERLRSEGRQISVIMMTGHGDIPAAVRSMKLGAVDFLEKPIDPHTLVERAKLAIQQIASTQDHATRKKLAIQRLASLTDRERELLSLLGDGKSSKQIAVEMHLSQRTVENHRAHLLAKTAAQNVAELVRLSVLGEMP